MFFRESRSPKKKIKKKLFLIEKLYGRSESMRGIFRYFFNVSYFYWGKGGIGFRRKTSNLKYA